MIAPPLLCPAVCSSLHECMGAAVSTGLYVHVLIIPYHSMVNMWNGLKYQLSGPVPDAAAGAGLFLSSPWPCPFIHFPCPSFLSILDLTTWSFFVFVICTIRSPASYLPGPLIYAIAAPISLIEMVCDVCKINHVCVHLCNAGRVCGQFRQKTCCL